MYRTILRKQQKGAVIIMASFFLLFLLGFMGIALDFGRLFIIKTELQTAMDSCALAAVQELDFSANALTRARSAGTTAGNLNNVGFQSATWSGKGRITDTDITFRDASYTVTTNATLAKYAQCQHIQAGVSMWLLKMMGAFTGDHTTFGNTQNVVASAVATRTSAQTTCPVPIAVKPKSAGMAPNYGFTPGEWVTLLTSQSATQGGQIGWANLDGSQGAAETAAELEGRCGTRVGDKLGTQVGDQLKTPGSETGVADEWNYRFGIYKNNFDVSAHRPDFTGYAYTVKNWPSQNNAYSGMPGASTEPTAQNFITKRSTFASCADTGTNIRGTGTGTGNGNGSGPSCESITGLSLNTFQNLAPPGNTTGGHMQYGSNRRIVTVPVIDGAGKVIDYVCMLMLQPLSIPLIDVKLEFIGNASNNGSPCTAGGLPGGSAGPLVPGLVR